MRAVDIMTTSVITANPEMTVRIAAGTMVFAGISGMPVIDPDGKLLGIVTEGDLMRREEIGTGKRQSWWLESLASTSDLANMFVKENATKVKDVMSTEVVTITEACPVAEIAELLEGRRIKRVPVVRDGKLVGVVSRANLIRALVTVVPKPTLTEGDDAGLREAILLAMTGQRWALPRENVIVKDATAHLWAAARSDEERRAIRVAAETVPGVKEVVMHTEPPVGLAAM
jgi:CBS domain-containing protein